jgi:hypothetical protein
LQNSAPRAGVVKGISYTIGDDAPWSVPIMESQPSSSPRPAKLPSYTTTISATQQIHVPDHGPPTTRQTRLPIFDQVRNMLNKSNTSIKCEEMSGDLPESGARASTWDNVFSTRRYSPSLKSLKTKKNSSNVSVLRDSETSSMASGQSSPTSSPARSMAPSQVSVNSVSQLPRGVTAKNQVKRKPVMSLSPAASENVPPQDLLTVPDVHLHSRFSWSTAAPSLMTKRGSTDTTATGNGRPPLMSHFSWTTIATSAAPTPMEETEEESTTLPPMPLAQIDQSYFAERPNESILSRKRPVQRIEKEECVPSTPRQRAATNSSSDSTPHATPSSTPRARTFSLSEDTPKRPSLASNTTTPTIGSGKKALPLLPGMSGKQDSHVEMLLTQERNLAMQRCNIERAITDLENVERASPLEVSFAAVRDAKRKLEERRETLREVKLEEMDIGIKIARARRREDFGDGEGTLWVRRVTG